MLHPSCPGATGRARDDLATTIEIGLAAGAVEDVYVAQAQLALLAAKEGAWDEAGRHARAAQALVDEAGLGDYSSSAIVHVATARVALHEARHADTRAALTRAHRLRPLLDCGVPWLTVEVGLELTRVHLTLTEAGAARTILCETETVLELRPHMGTLGDDFQGAACPLGGEYRVRRRLGDEPDRRGAAAAPVPRHPSFLP